MATMRAKDLIDLFDRMLAERWAYEWGAAREGCVDCSGAFVYAFRKLGGTMAEHSSNYMARRAVGELMPASVAQPGWAVFKRRDQSADTPSRWRDGLGDFYHVGLMSRDGKVLNAKGTRDGFVASPLAGWDYAAKLRDVKYGEVEDMAVLYRAEVATQKDPLRVRDGVLTGRIIGHVPKGAMVDVLTANTEWPRIRYGELVGYASVQYLRRVDDTPDKPTEELPDESGEVAEALPTTTLVGEDGQTITLLGRWRVAED